MESQAFTSIDVPKWLRIQAAVKDKTGIVIDADSGTAGAKGITISWNYSPDTQTLVIPAPKRSFYDPSEQTIETDLAQLINQA